MIIRTQVYSSKKTTTLLHVNRNTNSFSPVCWLTCVPVYTTYLQNWHLNACHDNGSITAIMVVSIATVEDEGTVYYRVTVFGLDLTFLFLLKKCIHLPSHSTDSIRGIKWPKYSMQRTVLYTCFEHTGKKQSMLQMQVSGMDAVATYGSFHFYSIQHHPHLLAVTLPSCYLIHHWAITTLH